MSDLTCSIAMATYNGEQFIIKQLESIINQTHAVDEIVISDDASTDNTRALIEEYSNRHKEIKWKILYNDFNLGYSKNFKKAITATEGDVIFLCDQDDLWNPNKVQELLEKFEENPTILSVITNFKVIDEYDSFVRPTAVSENIWVSKRVTGKTEELYKIHLREILGHNWAPGCTQAIRKEILGTYAKIRSNMVHDWLLNIIAAFSGGCYYWSRQLTYYRIHSSNTIGMSLEIVPEDKYTFIQKFYELARAFKYFYLRKMGSDCRKDLLNLPVETLKMIEEFSKCKDAIEKKELEDYHQFEENYINAIRNRKLLKYLHLRIRYCKFFEEQNRVGLYSEWASKLMKDLCAILKK